MSEPTFRELARRRGIYPTAKNLRRQGCSLASAMRMLLGVDPIPVLTDIVMTGEEYTRRAFAIVADEIAQLPVCLVVRCMGCDSNPLYKSCARCHGRGVITVRRGRR